jgi:broad specificity phosphatase PhoE
MQLFIIRHGQSANNVIEHLSQRHQDPPLTPPGEQQAALLAAFLARGGHLSAAERQDGRARLDQLLCSPMRRALQTARPCGAALGLAPEVWVDLHEIGGIYLDHGGDTGTLGYPGQTRRQVQDEFPGYVLPPALGPDGWWNRPMEAAHQGQGRAIGVARALRARAGEDRRVALITHGDFTDSLLKALWGRLPAEGLYFEHGNTGITRIDLQAEGRLLVRYLDSSEHLPEGLRT